LYNGFLPGGKQKSGAAHGDYYPGHHKEAVVAQHLDRKHAEADGHQPGGAVDTVQLAQPLAFVPSGKTSAPWPAAGRPAVKSRLHRTVKMASGGDGRHPAISGNPQAHDHQSDGGHERRSDANHQGYEQDIHEAGRLTQRLDGPQWLAPKPNRSTTKLLYNALWMPKKAPTAKTAAASSA